MSPLMDGKEHRPLKERMTAKGDEGRTRVGHWIKGAGEQASLWCISFVQGLPRMFLSFVWNTEERKQRCVVIDRRIRVQFCF